ncbi:MAG: ORF6N domain-containing protein [Flavobacteriales bacterium]|nr:ORF6N domain-containing protein [Flavobacteriales bacterium]
MQLQVIQKKIYEIRGQKVMLDFDLAELYEVETRILNQAVKRNLKRFPDDFMFQLNKTEWETLKSQIVISKAEKRGGTQKSPSAFTEQGLAMLSGILNSDKAIQVNIDIMRAFVFMRQYALTHKDLTDKLKELETKYSKQFKDVYEAINYLLQKDKLQKEQSERKRIGFKTGNDQKK